MGLLDRLSYPNLEAIPRNWNMTIMDTAAINDQAQLLLSGSEGKERHLIGDEPQDASERPVPSMTDRRTASTTFPEGSGESEDSTALVTEPPKKKRYNFIVKHQFDIEKAPRQKETGSRKQPVWKKRNAALHEMPPPSYQGLSPVASM